MRSVSMIELTKSGAASVVGLFRRLWLYGIDCGRSPCCAVASTVSGDGGYFEYAIQLKGEPLRHCRKHTEFASETSD